MSDLVTYLKKIVKGFIEVEKGLFNKQLNNLGDSAGKIKQNRPMFLLMIMGLLSFSVLIFLALSDSNSNNLNENEVAVSNSSNYYDGKNYEDVVADFQETGFENIEVKKIEDLITGWLTKDGEVESVSINGDNEFSSDDIFTKDSKVIVAYHTFATSDESESPSSTTSDVESDEQDNDTDSGEIQTDVLTAENNEDLAKLLISAAEDPFVGEFAEKYAGRTIEFDGCIATMDNHGSTTTRYDFLVYACDYSLTSAPGPSFQFRDVNFSDLHLTGSDSISAGYNLHIIAEVGDYNEMSQLLYLNPISTEVR